MEKKKQQQCARVSQTLHVCRVCCLQGRGQKQGATDEGTRVTAGGAFERSLVRTRWDTGWGGGAVSLKNFNAAHSRSWGVQGAAVLALRVVPLRSPLLFVELAPSLTVQVINSRFVCVCVWCVRARMCASIVPCVCVWVWRRSLFNACFRWLFSQASVAPLPVERVSRLQVRRDHQLRLVAAPVLEGVEVQVLQDGPARRARGGDRVREPAPRDEETPVGVHVRAVREAQTLGPQLRHLVVHALRVLQQVVSVLLLARRRVLLCQHLRHVDRSERPLRRPDVVLRDRLRGVEVRQVGVADAGKHGALEVARVLLRCLPRLVRRAGAELLVQRVLAHHRHSPRLAVDGQTSDGVDRHREVAARVDVAALRHHTHAVRHLADRRQDRRVLEELLEAVDQLLRRRAAVADERVGARAARVVHQRLVQRLQRRQAREVVLVRHVLTLLRIGGEDLGAPRAVEERTLLGLQRLEGGQHADALLHRRRHVVEVLPRALLVRLLRGVATDRSRQVVVRREAEGLDRAEHRGPHVLAGDGLPVVEMDQAVRVPLRRLIIVGPRVLPRASVVAVQGVDHLVVRPDDTVVHGTRSLLHAGLRRQARRVLGEVGDVAGVRHRLQVGTRRLRHTVLEVGGVGAQVDDATRVAVLPAGGAGRRRVQDVALVHRHDVVTAPQRQRNLPHSRVVQVQAVARQRTLLDGDDGVELRRLAVLVEGTDVQVRLRRPVHLSVRQDVDVRRRQAPAAVEDRQQPLQVVRVRQRRVRHVRVAARRRRLLHVPERVLRLVHEVGVETLVSHAVRLKHAADPGRGAHHQQPDGCLQHCSGVRRSLCGQ
eukprot:Rhum_TRINITY_DN15218_c2_g1::Rhum_TRINITY_DN15218_c2_g1_i2::g.145409::m.145409